MDDYELEEIYNAAIDGEGKTVFDGLRAVVMAEREARGKPKAWMNSEGFVSSAPGGGYDVPLYAL